MRRRTDMQNACSAIELITRLFFTDFGLVRPKELTFPLSAPEILEPILRKLSVAQVCWTFLRVVAFGAEHLRRTAASASSIHPD